MLLILLVIVSILFEVIIIVGGIYLILKLTKSKSTIKIKSSIRPISIPISHPSTRIKTNVKQPYDSIYVTGTTRETPIKHSDGDLIPYGLSDEDKELLEMFYDKNS